MTNPIPMPFNGKDVPHLVIEVNQHCNLNCISCYKDKRPYTKPLEQIKEEIDFGASERNLDVITLAGGEPTLHPELPSVIQYVHDKGIKVNVLTNGVAIDDKMLRSWSRAGATRVMLHIDSLQGRPDAAPNASEDELNDLRERMTERVVRHGMHGGLALTAYQKNKHEIPAVLSYVQQSPWVSTVLITCSTRFAPIAEKFGGQALASRYLKSEPEGEELTTRELAEILSREIALDPTQYVESNLRDSEWRWLLYLGFAMGGRGRKVKTLSLSSKYRRTIDLGNALQKFLKGRYKFDMVPGPVESVVVCTLYGLLSLDRRNLFRTGRFLASGLKPGSKIGSKVIVIQQAPNLSETGELEYCKNCPDATVRNGKIVPLCVADILSPIVVQ